MVQTVGSGRRPRTDPRFTNHSPDLFGIEAVRGAGRSPVSVDTLPLTSVLVGAGGSPRAAGWEVTPGGSAKVYGTNSLSTKWFVRPSRPQNSKNG